MLFMPSILFFSNSKMINVTKFILELRVWFEDELFSWESTPSRNFSHSSTGYETCTSLKLNGGWYVTIARTQRFVNIIQCWKKTEQNKKIDERLAITIIMPFTCMTSMYEAWNHWICAIMKANHVNDSHKLCTFIETINIQCGSFVMFINSELILWDALNSYWYH